MLSDARRQSSEIAAHFKAINQDGTGQIKYSEFVAALVDEVQFSSHDQLEAAFQRLDVRLTRRLAFCVSMGCRFSLWTRLAV